MSFSRELPGVGTRVLARADLTDRWPALAAVSPSRFGRRCRIGLLGCERRRTIGHCGGEPGEGWRHANLPFRDRPQTWVRPRKSKLVPSVSGWRAETATSAISARLDVSTSAIVEHCHQRRNRRSDPASLMTGDDAGPAPAPMIPLLVSAAMVPKFATATAPKNASLPPRIIPLLISVVIVPEVSTPTNPSRVLPPIPPLRETEFCGLRLAGEFRGRTRENGRNSVRRPRPASLTDRNCEGFCPPGNRVGLQGLHGGGCRNRTDGHRSLASLQNEAARRGLVRETICRSECQSRSGQIEGTNYESLFARKPQSSLAFVPQVSNGRDVLKGAQAPHR